MKKIWAFPLLVLFAACEPQEAPEMPVEAPPAVSEGEADLLVAPEMAGPDMPEPPQPAFFEQTDVARIEITLPDSELPEGIAELLLARSSADLDQFRAGAEADAHTAESDDYIFRPWTYDVDWQDVGPSSGPLRSYRAQIYVDTGGAHPGHDFDIVNYDTGRASLIGIGDLFTDLGIAMDTLSLALEEALMDAKRERLAEFDISEEEMRDWVLPATEKRPENFTTFVLTPTEAGDKVAGLTFLYEPYAVGAYAEGSYTAFVPADLLRADLAPEYQDAFSAD